MAGAIMTSTVEQPLVSCIMPTANRRRFVPLAIKNFLQQDYPHRELVILDDGQDSVADLLPPDPCIKYMRTVQRQTVGAKRNQCVRASQGELIMHWDDDDWAAPHRIRYQVEKMLGEGAEVCGLRQMLFHELASGKTWLYTYPPNLRTWVAGGSMLYTRNFWQRSPFPDVQVGEDSRFLWKQARGKLTVLDDYRFYVAMIHPENTSPKVCGDPYWMPSSEDPRAIMGNALDLYHAEREAPAQPARTWGGKRMKLNLGCCDAVIPGFVNVDIVPGPGVDQVADLSMPWPWADNSVELVRAWDIIEHLPDKIETMNEIYRVLAPGGRAEIAVPTTDGTGAFQDPTHVSFWNRRSFLYYEAGNPYRERFANSYGIKARFRTVSERIDGSVDGPRLTILLEAVKP
jgi:glycosyltransferase involved in cell wall biosynthesis